MVARSWATRIGFGCEPMIQQTPEAERFKKQMRDSLQHETLNSRPVTIARHANVYTCGDQDEMVYFIETGQIKLLLLSPEGKESLLAIHSGGDIFGELCLAGLGARRNRRGNETNEDKTNTLCPVLCASEPRLFV